MNDATTAIALGRRIDLTRHPDFLIGGVQIRPTACEVVASGRRVRLQPRVMQVLIALARSGGEPVSREALIEGCWGQVRVGDDALNRCVQRLRRLAEAEVGGAFVIETIPRLGYRLATAGDGASATPMPATPLLAVLAFDNLSGDPDMAWFSDGVSEEIQQTVARGADLRVIGRTSSFQFRGPDKVITRVAAELKATHVLDGSVRRSGDMVRIAAQLVECASQTSLWSDRFDRDLTDIFALQDEIAAAVAVALKATFASMTPVGRMVPAAYDLYLKTKSMSGGRPMPNIDAIAMLERAVCLAPDLLPAWAALAHRRATVNRRIALDWMAETVDCSDVFAAAERALALDPGCGLAHAALGLLLPWGDYLGRDASLRQALSMGLRDPQAVVEMGWFMASVGRNEEGLAYATESLALDPLDARAANIYSQLLAVVGRYDDSQRAYAGFQEKWPLTLAFTIVPLSHAAFMADWEEFDRLRRAVADLELSGRYVDQALASAAMLRDPTSKRRQRMLEVIGEQIHQAGTVTFGPLVLAYKMGLTEEVFSFIGQASFAHLFEEDGPPPASNLSPGIIFDRAVNLEMMADARFAGFCSKLGLCDYWVKTDRWPDCAADDVLPYDFKAECRRLATA